MMRRRFLSTAAPAMRHAPRTQRGAVLAISLIFLAILSLVGLYTMRGSILGEQVSKNLRSNEVATQAAETALRFCEDRVRTGGALIVHDIPLDLGSEDGLPTRWESIANWTNNTVSVELPSSALTGTGMRPLPVLPRCMVERFTLPPASGESIQATASLRPHLITAVGYSADFERNANQQAISGSEVWLQSVFIP